ncbi:MAG: hypothetical protein HY322_03015 [Betaproteobacteria bacterium]|nr:hypothetical protein [Betaproteobacteria bacterium]
MLPEQALSIVRAIARGEDPYNPDTPLRAVSLVQAETVHALCISLAFLLDRNRDGVPAGSVTPTLDLNELPSRGDLALDKYLAQIELNEIQRCVNATNQNVARAAHDLGITYRTLRYKLESAAERPVELTINFGSMPERGSVPLEDYMAAIERVVIAAMLVETKNNRTEAARRLGLTYRAFRYRLESLQLDLPD